METEGRLRLSDVVVSIDDPRQAAKVEHDLVELLVVAVNAVLVGADTFVEIELWAKEKLTWLRNYLGLANGIPSHDTFARMFGLIDPEQFEDAFRAWLKSILPTLGAEIVAIDGKTSRRSGGVDATALHLVSAFAASAGLVLGQRATAEKSNEITAIPELLSTWRWPVAQCPSTRWAHKPPSLKPFGAAEPTTCWGSRTTSPNWQSRWRTSGAVFAPTRTATRRTRLPKQWRRITDGWRRAAVTSSINWNVWTNPTDGKGCAPLRYLNRSAPSAITPPTNSVSTSASWLRMRKPSPTRSGPIGLSKTACTGAWMCL